MGGQPNMRQGARPDQPEPEKSTTDISNERYEQTFAEMLKRREQVLRIDKILSTIITTTKGKPETTKIFRHGPV
jgi:hypothetical protein